VRPITRVVASCLAACLVVLAASASATAAPKRITGELNRPGYTVIALAANGQAAVVRAQRRRFRLTPPAGRVTLHLRAPDATYAGPIAVGSKARGRRAVVGVRAGARLGRIRIRRGYAKPSRRLRRRWVDARRVARARSGVPIGAAVFGRVRSRQLRRAVPGDGDVDGVPDPLDVDDDGDLVFDSLDRASAARAAEVPETFFQQSYMQLFLHQTAHANALDSSGRRIFDDPAIEATFQRFSDLAIEIIPGPGFRELDCGQDDPDTPQREGRVYCSHGDPPSTGRYPSPSPSGASFPGAPGDPLGFDPDGDGFGRLSLTGQGAAGGTRVPYHPGAMTHQIGTGDNLIEWVAADGVPENECPPANPPACEKYTTNLQFVFGTPVALVSYDDGTGTGTGTVPYPVRGSPGPLDPPCPEPCPGPDPGTQFNGFPVTAGADGQVRVTLAFWRPQRRPIKPDSNGLGGDACLNDDPPCEWIDVGGLNYVAGPADRPTCPESAYTVPDAGPLRKDPGLAVLIDGSPDTRAHPANTVTYTLNLTECLAARGHSFNPGEQRLFSFMASPPTSSDRVLQWVSFRREDGNLIVRKQTNPPESPTRGTEFQFNPDDAIAGPAAGVGSPGADFELRHDGSRSFAVPPGTYTVDELVPSGYELTGVVCDDSNSTGTTQPPRATFRIEAGERVACTFTNTP
jgi:hypothetical protein